MESSVRLVLMTSTLFPVNFLPPEGIVMFLCRDGYSAYLLMPELMLFSIAIETFKLSIHSMTQRDYHVAKNSGLSLIVKHYVYVRKGLLA